MRIESLNSLLQYYLILKTSDNTYLMLNLITFTFQTFWSYVTGMLMNLDTLPLERIHQVLKMFAFQGPTTECSLQELKHFLDRKVREHQLVYSNGYYKLPKP